MVLRLLGKLLKLYFSELFPQTVEGELLIVELRTRILCKYAYPCGQVSGAYCRIDLVYILSAIALRASSLELYIAFRERLALQLVEDKNAYIPIAALVKFAKSTLANPTNRTEPIF